MLKIFKSKQEAAVSPPRFEPESEFAVRSERIESLSDGALDELNQLLPWKCFTVDQQGRAFGGIASASKRAVPQRIPDARINAFHERFDLTQKTVLEIGCFEGVHSLGLLQHGARLVAIDARIVNVAKTAVRCNAFGYPVDARLCDIEKVEQFRALPDVDLCHHVGVLYHLKDPVRHLQELTAKVSQGLLLDTHYATDEMAESSYEVDGRPYRCFEYGEFGYADVFSGMNAFSRWLPLESLVDVLKQNGFSRCEVFDDRRERNGPRVTLYASRDG